MKLCVCLAVLCFLILQCSAAYGQTPKRNDRSAKWEYKQLSSPSDDVLNHYAKEGWELAAASGGGGDSSRFDKIILKRSKSHPQFGTKTAEPPEPKPPAQNTKCNLTLAQAPVIRGLRLGMTSDELFAIFPTKESEEFNRAQQMKNAELPPHYGYTSLQLIPSSYATKDRFTGIGRLTFELFDRKVVSIQADYSDTSYFASREQFTEIIAKHFELPDFKDWAGYSENRYDTSISCDGFTFQVIGYRYQGQYSIKCSDQAYKKIPGDRRQADQAKKREGFKP
jgi:hypothetical protein